MRSNRRNTRLRLAVPAAILCLFCGGGIASAQGLILPRLSITPGVFNYDVKNTTIAATICKSGWTKTIRPSTSYTNALKLQQMQQYGETGSPSDYEEDHLIPLELGGAPKNPKNLWPEPHSQSSHSDPYENSLKRQVCDGTLTLKTARQQIRQYKRTKG
jgi:hypothetical protein